MKFIKLIPLYLILLTAFSCTSSENNIVLNDDDSSSSYKVLSSDSGGLSINNINDFLSIGDQFIEEGEFDKAKDSYDKARNLAKQISNFYRDLSGSFRGLDARIPREMDDKGRKSLNMWAEANSRLAALYIRKNQSEVAVPLLIEIIRLLTPASPEGKEAYNMLLELGFVETPFRGS